MISSEGQPWIVASCFHTVSWDRGAKRWSKTIHLEPDDKISSLYQIVFLSGISKLWNHGFISLPNSPLSHVQIYNKINNNRVLTDRFLQLRTYFPHMNLQMCYEWYLDNPNSISWLHGEYLLFEFHYHGCFIKISVFLGIIHPWVLKLTDSLHLRYDGRNNSCSCPLNETIKLGIKRSKLTLYDFMIIVIKFGL